jgi:hypothetical protein
LLPVDQLPMMIKRLRQTLYETEALRCNARALVNSDEPQLRTAPYDISATLQVASILRSASRCWQGAFSACVCYCNLLSKNKKTKTKQNKKNKKQNKKREQKKKKKLTLRCVVPSRPSGEQWRHTRSSNQGSEPRAQCVGVVEMCTLALENFFE